MGHKADYTLSASDIPGAVEKNGPEKAQTPKDKTEDAPVSAAGVGSGPIVDQAALTKSLETALDKKLEPIVRMLGKQEKLLLEEKYGGPKLTDIVGGIGWIVGLFGLAAFFLSRNGSAEK